MEDIVSEIETTQARSVSDNEALKDHFKKLKNTIWITKGCRFNASRRLNKQAEFSNVAVFLLSFSVACLSLVGLLYSELFNEFQVKTIGVSTIIISFFIIFVVILENGKSYRKRAYILYRCGLELTELYRGLAVLEDLDELDVEEFIDLNVKYDEIMNRHLENHENRDYVYFQCVNPKRFEKFYDYHSPPSIWWKKTSYQIHPYLVVATYLILPALGLIATGYVLINEDFSASFSGPIR